MSGRTKGRPRRARAAWLGLELGLELILGLACGLLPARAARAGATCLDKTMACEPDKICTFKDQLATKVYIYQLYLANSQQTKKTGTRDTIAYSGDLYDAAVAAARSAAPNSSGDALKESAGSFFQDMVRAKANARFSKALKCSSGKVDPTLLPVAQKLVPGTTDQKTPEYEGMHTTAACQIFVTFEKGEYDAESFGKADTVCQEFYDTDYTHEVIHQLECKDNKTARHPKNILAIDDMIEAEIRSYEHSVRLLQAYVRLLAIRCSPEAMPAEVQARIDRIEQLVGPYLKRKK
jgi:hypothetical protein